MGVAVAPVAGGGEEDADQFGAIEGLGEHIMSAQIEGFGLEGFIGDSGGHDEVGRPGEAGEPVEGLLPGAGAQIAIAEHDLNNAAPQQISGRGETGRGADDPAGSGEEAAKDVVVARSGAE